MANQFTTLSLGSGRPLDPGTVYNQIGQWSLIRVGADLRNRFYSEDYVQFDMTLDRKRRRCYIQLNGNDLYNVEVGYRDHYFDWHSLYVIYDVPAENLSQTVEAAFEKVME